MRFTGVAFLLMIPVMLGSHNHPADTTFEALLQSSLDAIVLTDDSGVVVEFNGGAETIFGWARSEALGASIGDLIVPERLRRAHDAGMARMRDGGAAKVLGRRVEMPALRRTGEEFPCEVALSTFMIEGKRVFAAIMRDMSELRAALEEQRRAAAFLQSIFDDQTEVIFRFDAAFRLNYANDAALRFYAIKLHDFLGRHMFEDVEPDVADRLRAEIAALTPDAPTTRAVDPKRLPNGEIRWIDWTNRALFDETGARTGYLSVGRDVTEKRESELALEREREVNALYRRMVEAMPDSVYAKDLEGRYLTGSRKLAAICGVDDVSAVLGRRARDFIAVGVADAIEAEERAFYASGLETQTTTVHGTAEDGQHRSFLKQRALFRDAEGEVTGLIAHIRDVTEQVLAEKALAESEARTRTIVDYLGEGLALFSSDLRIQIWNPAFERIVMPTSHDLKVGDSFEDLVRASIRAGTVIFPWDEDTAVAEIVGYLRGHAEGVVTKMGGGRWTETSAFPAPEDAYLILVRDITEQVLAQKALAESEARFATFMQNAPVGMYLKDPEGRYLLANPEMANVFGRPVDEVIGLAAKDLFEPDLVAVIDAADDAVRRTGQPSAIEEYMPGVDRYAWTLVVRFPFAAADGSGVMIGGFDIDITGIKRAEEEVARARDALHESEKLTTLGAFAAGVAHELNNPLTIIAGQAAMLAEEAEGGTLAERAAKIERVAERCGRIARSFLSIARRRPPQRVAVDLGGVIDTALEIASFTLRNAGIRVERRMAEGLPPVSGDPDQLHQVVLNLLLNAHQAMAAIEGPRVITLEAALAGGGRRVRLDVRDTGPGVPPEDGERIFEPFFTTRAAGGGTGLGLSISRAVVEGFGGSLELAEGPGGAVFRVMLDVAEPT